MMHFMSRVLVLRAGVRIKARALPAVIFRSLSNSAEESQQTGNSAEEVRTKVLECALKRVVTCGWSDEALAKGTVDAG
jgi:hypothetical protein